jgi:hypothetical protein
MSGSRRCQGCGRRLTDVLFCTRCGGWFCSPSCLADDKSRHLRASRPSDATARIAGSDGGPPTQHEVMIETSITFPVERSTAAHWEIQPEEPWWPEGV